MFKTNAESDVGDYFSSINSMAKRIMMDAMALQVGEKWRKMSYEEQCDLMMKTFLKPALTTEKYSEVEGSDGGCFPKLKVASGQKYVFEEENGNKNRSGNSWRDEYSAPFIWESQSQLDLNYILREEKQEETPTEEVPSSGDVPQVEDPPVEKVIVVEETANKTPEAPPTKKVHSRKKTAPAPPIPAQPPPEAAVTVKKTQALTTNANKRLSVEVSPTDDDEEPNIPKTGFDFLDNW